MGNCGSVKQKPQPGQAGNKPQQLENLGRPTAAPSTPRQQSSMPLEIKDEDRIPQSARNIVTQRPVRTNSQPNSDVQPKADAEQITKVASAPAETKQPARQVRVFSQEERYRMLCSVFSHLQKDDVVSMRTIFEQFEGYHLGFIVNQDSELSLEDGQDTENMFEWSLLDVALALKATKCFNHIIKNKLWCILPKVDFTDPDLQLGEAPNLIDYDMNELLDIEMRNLRTCLILDDHKMTQKIWKRFSWAWESCHFYKFIEMIVQRKDQKALESFLPIQNSDYVKLFYEPSVLQDILDENPNIPPHMQTKISLLIHSYQVDQQSQVQIADWETTFDLESDQAWEASVWNTRSSDSEHSSYQRTIDAIQEVANFYSIESQIDGSSISPIHFLFAKHTKNGSSSEKLLERIQNIEMINIKNLVKLQKLGHNPRQIEQDSFLDGGLILLLCLKNNRQQLVEYLLGDTMVQFWRFTQLKTLVWACFNSQGDTQANSKILKIVMESPCMHASYSQLTPIMKICFCGWLMDCSQDSQSAMVSLLCEKPFQAAFICDNATMEQFQDNQFDAEFFEQFSKACDNATIYELDQLAFDQYDGIRDFIGFIHIQDQSSQMYKSGMQFANLCKMTRSMANIQQEALEQLNNKDESAIIDDDDFGAEQPFPATQDATQEIVFKIDNFKESIIKNEESNLLSTLISSNNQTNNTTKVPMEAMFIDWESSEQFVYLQPKAAVSAAQVVEDQVEAEPKPDSSNKGKLDLSDCNLAHRFIAKGFALDQIVTFLLDEFVLFNVVGQEKQLPACTMILNRNPNFNKGINKILKMISMQAQDCETIVAFMVKSFPVGLLTYANLRSLLNFLLKVSRYSSETREGIQAKSVLRALFEAGFFEKHLSSMSNTSAQSFNYRLNQEIEVTPDEELAGFLSENQATSQQVPQTDIDNQGKLQTQLIRQIHNFDNCYDTERFISLLKQVSGCQDGGWDSKIRFSLLHAEELSPGKIDKIVLKSECSPLLLAIKASNLKAVKDLLENDKCLNLRESLRGPADIHNPDNGLWNYEFQGGDLVLQFQSLGMALIADCEQNDKNYLAILIALTKQATFVPEVMDFESFVTVCRGSTKTMMLKAFVQTYQMQFIFCSLPYESQKRITRLLLGLTADGEDEIFAMLDSNIILKRPYMLVVLALVLESRGKISQINDISRDLLTHLTSDQIVLASFIDPHFPELVIEVDQELQTLKNDDQNDQMLVNNMTKLVHRLKTENIEKDIAGLVLFNEKVQAVDISVEAIEEGNAPRISELKDWANQQNDDSNLNDIEAEISNVAATLKNNVLEISIDETF